MPLEVSRTYQRMSNGEFEGSASSPEKSIRGTKRRPGSGGVVGVVPDSLSALVQPPPNNIVRSSLEWLNISREIAVGDRYAQKCALTRAFRANADEQTCVMMICSGKGGRAT